MPIDIVVLPEAQPGAAPIAMGCKDGRCKLVFAMRGNPAAESTLASIPAPLLQATLEAMTAHEIGHCQRHRSGAFDSLPAGLSDKPDAIESRQPTAELQAIAREMRITRREEAFADLVGLAWTHARHADQFGQVLAWFDEARSDETPRGFHDTRHWLALAHAPDAFAGDSQPDRASACRPACGSTRGSSTSSRQPAIHRARLAQRLGRVRLLPHGPRGLPSRLQPQLQAPPSPAPALRARRHQLVPHRGKQLRSSSPW